MFWFFEFSGYVLVTLFRVKIKIQFRLSLMGDYQTANISKRNQKIRAQNYPESKALQNGNTAWRSRGFLLVYVKPEDICAVDWTLVSPQIHMLKPVSSVMAFGGRAFGRGLGPESRALMKGMGALIRRGPQSLLPPTLFSTKERRYSFTNQRAGPH